MLYTEVAEGTNNSIQFDTWLSGHFATCTLHFKSAYFYYYLKFLKKSTKYRKRKRSVLAEFRIV